MSYLTLELHDGPRAFASAAEFETYALSLLRLIQAHGAQHRAASVRLGHAINTLAEAVAHGGVLDLYRRMGIHTRTAQRCRRLDHLIGDGRGGIDPARVERMEAEAREAKANGPGARDARDGSRAPDATGLSHLNHTPNDTPNDELPLTPSPAPAGASGKKAAGPVLDLGEASSMMAAGASGEQLGLDFGAALERHEDRLSELSELAMLGRLDDDRSRRVAAIINEADRRIAGVLAEPAAPQASEPSIEQDSPSPPVPARGDPAPAR